MMSAGRALAVCRLEFGKRTRMTSPRLWFAFGGVIVVIGAHLRAVPLVYERRQTIAQLRSLLRINAAGCEIYGRCIQKGHDDGCLLDGIVGLLQQFYLSVSVDPTDLLSHGKIGRASCRERV